MLDARTCLYGLQRPPVNGQLTMIRCGEKTSLDDLAPILLPFVTTNASTQVQVSVHPNNAQIIQALTTGQVKYDLNDDAAFDTRVNSSENESSWYNLVEVEAMNMLKEEKYPLAAQWVSLWFPLGHIKSTKPNDQHFLQLFGSSVKWLQVDNK